MNIIGLMVIPLGLFLYGAVSILRGPLVRIADALERMNDAKGE